MAYKVVGTLTGVNISNIDSDRVFPIGTEIELLDSTTDFTYGMGAAIYLPGVASLAVGSAVIYNAFAGTVVLADSDATSTSRGRIAISLTANTSHTHYSWYLVRGVISAVAGTIAAANTPVFLSSTAGTLDDSGATHKLESAIWRSTDSGGFATVEINYPFCSGDS